MRTQPSERGLLEAGGRRALVFAHYDPDGYVAPHVRFALRQLAAVIERTVVVSTARLRPADRAWLAARFELVERENVGHDFSSYRTGLEAVGTSGWDEIVMANDSCVMPLVPSARIFEAMAGRPTDVWGLVQGRGFAPHIQSFFLVFRSRALSSTAFERFWSEVEALPSREEVVVRYEVGLSRTLLTAGLRLDCYFRMTPCDRLEGSARAAAGMGPADAGERGVVPLVRSARRVLRDAQHPEWNPSVALADRAIGSQVRLPLVKISTLRDDPYRLGAAQLLTACERRHHEAFEGVRAHILRTGLQQQAGAGLPLVPAVLRYRSGTRA